MVTLWNTCIDALEALSRFAKVVIDVFTTPLGKLFENRGLPPYYEWVLNSWNTLARIFGEDATLMSVMFTSGIIILIVVALVKFFLPTS